MRASSVVRRGVKAGSLRAGRAGWVVVVASAAIRARAAERASGEGSGSMSGRGESVGARLRGMVRRVGGRTREGLVESWWESHDVDDGGSSACSSVSRYALSRSALSRSIAVVSSTSTSAASEPSVQHAQSVSIRPSSRASRIANSKWKSQRFVSSAAPSGQNFTSGRCAWPHGPHRLPPPSAKGAVPTAVHARHRPAGTDRYLGGLQRDKEVAT